MQQDLMSVIDKSAANYANYVTGSRHFPDYRDGLKPVQRFILWSLYNLKSSPTSQEVKSSRVCGDVIGRFHPHDTEAAYLAMVNMTKSRSPMGAIEGEGNFGSFSDPPAAMRYTSVRLSKFGMTFLDPDYLDNVPTVWTYTSEERVPIYLPALLPATLLLGGSGIGYGLKYGAVPFTLESVAKLTLKALLGKASIADYKKLEMKLLHPAEYSKLQLHRFIETGNGLIRIKPSIIEDDKGFTVNGFDESVSLEKLILRFTEHEDQDVSNAVTSVRNYSDAKINVRVNVKRGADKNKVRAVLVSALTISEGLSNTLLEYLDPDADAKHETNPFLWDVYAIPAFMEKWLTYRVSIEMARIQYQINNWKTDRSRVAILIEAVNRLPELAKLLQSREGNLKERIQRLFNCTPEQAEILMSTQVRRLSNADAGELRQKHADITANIVAGEARLAKPVDSTYAKLKSDFSTAS